MTTQTIKTPEQIAKKAFPHAEGATLTRLIGMIEADRAQRRGHGYSVGDPDPTAEERVGNCPEVNDGGYFCTWPAGHEGDHIAGTGYLIAAVWS
jgi:hypothetical protein